MNGPQNPIVMFVDDMFPRLRAGNIFSGRKHAEYVGLMNRLEGSLALCPPSQNFPAEVHARSKENLSAATALDQDRFFYGTPPEYARGGLAYAIFPHKAMEYLPYMEARDIRFVVAVYPGGGFLMWGAGAEASLARLTTLAAHPLFRGFVVHHGIIQEYLACRLPDAPVHAFDGGFSQIDPGLMGSKTYFGRDRTTLNLCFMANRYEPLGLGKGFDIFLESARLASQRFHNTTFHVVGDWPQDQTAGVRPRDPVKFHGYVSAASLPGFFRDMDIIVSPTRIDVPVEGKFDGFPLVIDASVCGVAICATDPLSQNKHYRNGEDLWIIDADARDVVAVIERVIASPKTLENVATSGMQITRRTRNYVDKMEKKASLLHDLALQG